MNQLNVVVLKPSKYGLDGYVERFWKGFMPNATVPFIRSMIPQRIKDTEIITHSVDEYVHTDLEYFKLFDAQRMGPTLLLLVGVQSNQFQRALDLAAYATKRGCHAVIGGPHSMTCDTSMLQGNGVSFSQSEAESVLPTILNDAISNEGLQPVYGVNQRWANELESPVLIPPSRRNLQRYIVPLMGFYPYRGCPFTCNFCSVIKIAGRKVRGQSLDTTVASLKAAKSAGVRMVMFTSDNFNKIPDVNNMLNAMIEKDCSVPFFCQCDTQIAGEPELVELMARAGCFDIFVGVESFDSKTLSLAHKYQNKPQKYSEIIRLCRQWGISAHFSSIIGFPDDTEEKVLDHLDTLKQLDPAMASFYVLCPIPGTEQYDDFMKAGLISESNLDRFDTIQPVWDHSYLSKVDRSRLLMKCYREFYSLKHTIGKLKYIKNKLKYNLLTEIGGSIAYTAFSRWCTFKNKHPMSGGIGEFKRDHVSDYINLRRQTYGYELVPLPRSLKLSAADELKNRVNLKLVLAH